MNFDDFNISTSVRKAIADMGFKNATPIQERAIPVGLEGRDITGQAQTGSGKTLAFAVPILEKLFIPDRSPQAIVLCPTRELCVQVAGEMEKLGAEMGKLKVLAVYGGQPIGKQLRVLKKGVHVVVGTPGRVIDHIERGSLDLIGIETVVLDEADEMLDMGFRDDIEEILKVTPRQRQTMLFSATMPDEIRRIARMYQKNPEFIKIASTKRTVPKITQYSFRTDERNKVEDMVRLIDAYDVKLSLVFCNTKKRVDYVLRQLKGRGYRADAIHGDMTQKVRDKVMNKFRNGNIAILVATDVAARGIDVENISVVINFDVPKNPEYYIHRIGRTARAGNAGYAFTLVSDYDAPYLANIKKSYNVRISQKNVPSFREVEEIKNRLVLEEVRNVIRNDDLKEYVEAIEKDSSSIDDYLEMAAAMLKMIRQK